MQTLGDPLHSRALTLELRAAAGGGFAVRGEVLDLRKRGLVPVPGALQLPGVIHRMEIEAEVDPATRRIARFEPRQPVVAFEASEATGGESCRDPAGALRALAGATLDGTFLARLSEAFGGPRGCTHLLTLARLLASGTARALDLEAALGRPARREGERVFRRVLALDGFELPEGGMELRVQLSDAHVRPAADVPPDGDSLDRLATQTEIRVAARLELATTLLRSLRAEERTRSRGALAGVPFRDRSEELRELVGAPLMAGFGARLVRRLGAPADAPLLDALLGLAPGYVQCVAAVSDLFLPGGRGAGALGAYPDSCFMWRSGGALQRARRAREEL
jgi:hypothetical protein